MSGPYFAMQTSTTSSIVAHTTQTNALTRRAVPGAAIPDGEGEARDTSDGPVLELLFPEALVTPRGRPSRCAGW